MPEQLVVEGRAVAAAAVLATRAERRQGLLGRDGVDGAVVLAPCRAVHSLGMRFPIDVAFLDGDGRVLRTLAPLVPQRPGAVVPRARAVVEAEAGAFARWGLVPGAVVAVVPVVASPS